VRADATTSEGFYAVGVQASRFLEELA